MKKLSIWGVGKLAMKAGMIITIVFVAMNVGALYLDYIKDNPEGDIYGFFTNEKIDRYVPWGSPSEEFVETVRLYNNTIRTVWFALFFFVMFEIFAYKENPKEHWFRYVIRKIEKASSKLDDKLEDE